GERGLATAPVFLEGGPAGLRRMLRSGCWWKISSCCIRRDVFTALGGLDTSFRQMGDADFVFRLLESGWDLEYIPVSLSFYRMHPMSVTANSFRRNFDLADDLRIFRKFSACLSAPEIRRGYYTRAHAGAHRVVHSLKAGQPGRAAGALEILLTLLVH